jgi:hypothetical protein
MGEAALKSHMTGKKHVELFQQCTRKATTEVAKPVTQLVLMTAETTPIEATDSNECKSAAAVDDLPSGNLATIKTMKSAAVATKNDVLSAKIW